MDEVYFVIQEVDGDVFIQQKSREELEKALTRDVIGACEYARVDEDLSFMTSLDNYNVLNTDLGVNGLLIIKGCIVAPELDAAAATYKIP